MRYGVTISVKVLAHMEASSGAVSSNYRVRQMSDPNTNALTTIIDALKPLKSEDRHRTVEAAMVFLGETAEAAPTERKGRTPGAGEGGGDGSHSVAAKKWMEQN